MSANIYRCAASRTRHLSPTSLACFSTAAVARTFASNRDASSTTVHHAVGLKILRPKLQLAAAPMASLHIQQLSSARKRAAFSYQRFSASSNSTAVDDNNNNNTQKIESPTQQTQSFLLSLGYSDAISDGIIDALLQNGIPPTSLLGMVKSLAGRYEVGEDGGLETLAASVKLELEKHEGKSKVKVWCVPSTGWSPAPDGIGDNDEMSEQLPTIHGMDRAFVVEATEGTTLTDVAKFGTSDNCDVLGEYLECACAGIMACSTCHVVIHPDWYDAADTTSSSSDHPDKIAPPSEAEQDMIDLAYEPQVTSRLGCQIKLTKELDGLVILLPSGSNNLMDFVPFDG